MIVKKQASFFFNIAIPVLIPAAVVVFNILIILFPKETIDAAKQGLSLWFNNVLPSLLPFIIGSNLLMGLGAVKFLGVLLEPLMSPLFGVPGNGGFAFAVGLMSGYPTGAKVVCELREKGEISKAEGQRLLSFVNNSGPLFVIGSVAAGMFNNAAAGYFILCTHYLSAILTGLLFKHYQSQETRTTQYYKSSYSRNILDRAFIAMLDARKRDGRPFGKILGQSVANAMETIVQIGGFIILFCVLSKALEIINFFSLLSAMLSLPSGLDKGIFMGIIEMTNGVKTISENGGSKTAFLAASAIISWGGLSIFAQTVSFIGKTDLSTGVYFISKLIHSVITVIIGSVLYPLFSGSINRAVPVAAFGQAHNLPVRSFFYSSAFFGLTVIALFIIVCVVALSQIKRRGRRYR